MTDPTAFRFSHVQAPADVVAGPDAIEPAQVMTTDPGEKPVIIVHRCAERGCRLCASTLAQVIEHAIGGLMWFGLMPTTRDAEGYPVEGRDPLYEDAENALRPLLMWAKCSEPAGPVSLAEQYVPSQQLVGV